jgi:hypothetical protein
MTTPTDPVGVYEQARQWGNRSGRVQIEICRRWNRWMMRYREDEVRRLRLIALDYGLDHDHEG